MVFVKDGVNKNFLQMLKKFFSLGDSSPETDLGSTSVLVWGHRGGTQGGNDDYLGDDDGDNVGDGED